MYSVLTNAIGQDHTAAGILAYGFSIPLPAAGGYGKTANLWPLFLVRDAQNSPRAGFYGMLRPYAMYDGGTMAPN